jgi:hypothetical protein
MDSSDLSHDQLEQLFARLAPMVSYLLALDNRIQSRGFPPDDELAAHVRKAHHAAQDLLVHVHYMACGKVVGRKGPQAKG